MYIEYRVTCFWTFVCTQSLLSAQKSHVTSDFYCYYTKDCPKICRIDENDNLINNWELTSVIESDGHLKKMARVGGFYRPRSALARALYEKQRNDRQLQELDQSEWYRVDFKRLNPDLKQKFVQLSADEETQKFLSCSIDKSSWVWTQIWYLLAKALLKYFWSITDINGWLGRGSMFVMSEAGARALLSRAGVTAPAASGRSLVDIGAGDGEVTRRFAHLFSSKYATEISGNMRKTLASKGFTVLDSEEWWRGQQFDCVCMLNLLDRCTKPRSMLQQAKLAIAPGGVLLLALVLPYKPYVEVTSDHKPEERLPIEGAGFEEQVASLVRFMSEEVGFELVSWARAPYLCEGDFAQAYYWLDDSIYVFKPKTIQTDI